MDIRALEQFREVARREHLSEAAAALHLTQPALSRTIARLEHELGVPLFDRQGRNLRLNPFGRAYLARIDQALAALDAGRRELADASGRRHGRVSVGIESTPTIAAVAARFRRTHPDVDLTIHQGSAPQLDRLLRDREIDLAILSQPPAGTVALTTLDLGAEPVGVAVATDHPLADREQITLAELATGSFVTVRPGHWQRRLLDELFAELGQAPRLGCVSDEPAATAYLVAAGLGIGLIPAMALEVAAEAPIRWLAVDHPTCERRLQLAWRTDGYLSLAARDFVDAAATELRHRTGSLGPR